MYKLYGIFVVLLVVLSGCDNNELQLHGVQASTPVIDEMVLSAESTGEPGNDFPDAALAVMPNPESERRESGSIGETETYYLSIVVNEEVGRCFSRRMEVKGTFYRNISKDWSVGNISKWDNSRTDVVVEIREDSTMCRGGRLVVFSGSAAIDGSSFELDESALSVRLYAEVPVYPQGLSGIKNVTIAIDGSRLAEGELAGGNISTSDNVEWLNGFDFTSKTSFEAVNILLDGGLYVDNFAVQGSVYARISKLVSSYSNNGNRPFDPFTGGSMSLVGGKG